MKKRVTEIRICCSGRSKGAKIARTECGKYGKISRNVFNQKIDYAPADASTRYGFLGVKVWISYSQKRKAVGRRTIERFNLATSEGERRVKRVNNRKTHVWMLR